MANRCVGLDPTWAHLPTPAPTHTAHAAAASHYYCSSSSPASLITSALRASMAPAHAYSASAAASSFSSPATPSSSASELLSFSGHVDAPAPESSRPGARALAGPRVGRVTKRKPRPSRRPPTTYITADPANFRRVVQEITGLPVPAASEAATVAAPNWTAAPACVLPTLDTSAFLLDRAAAAAVPAAPEEKSPGGGGHASSTATDAAVAVAAAAAGNDADSSALPELEALVCAAAGECGFPTLESWGMII
ncbi:calmodulin-binding protein 25-like [Miscanthus floridulus]|uniref:calmodulin-binding protein 25-like n=1 Tax=Miscanthus floridulus TaxID=154761 RepID=UPI0034588A08